MIIDAHIHAYSEDELNATLESMKKNKISDSIIMHWVFSNWGHNHMPVPSLTEMANRVSKYPGLHLIGAMKVTDKKNYSKNIKEIETLLKQKKIIGIKFYLGYEHFFANDSRAEPLYKLCIKYDVPAVFHTGDTWMTNETKDAMIRFANPVYIDDVATKFPKLKIMIAHLGNPWINETALIIAKNKNVYADLSGSLGFPGEYKKKYDKLFMTRILDVLYWTQAPEKLIFGSDYDIYSQKEYIDFVKSIPHLSSKNKENIFSNNARKLFKI